LHKDLVRLKQTLVIDYSNEDAGVWNLDLRFLLNLKLLGELHRVDY